MRSRGVDRYAVLTPGYFRAMPIGIFCPYRGDGLRQSFVEETNHICP
ncbi:MAG: hypothetical protein MR609_02985 [Bacteroidales bacterium]|nr:hypothetical protein [Bacteroidales bacterium]